MPPRRMADVTTLTVAVADLGTRATSLRTYREGALELLASGLKFDAALFHALSPRVPLDTAAVHGLDPARLAASQRGWDDLAVELGALREAANQALVAGIDQVFTPGSHRHKNVVARLHSQFAMRSLCILHLIVRERVGSAVVLMARRAQAFDAASLDVLRALGPTLALGDHLQQQLDHAPRASTPVRLQCVDERLTERQREIVERVALGHSNEQIATGLGLSANTVRNHLARVFARLGSSNRADLVRLAVLRPEHEA